MYEMDMRSFDPAIARWTSIDPVTHHSASTYNAFDNNPIYWADPSGADAKAFNGGILYSNTDKGKWESNGNGSYQNKGTGETTKDWERAVGETASNSSSSNGGDGDCPDCDKEKKTNKTNLRSSGSGDGLFDHYDGFTNYGDDSSPPIDEVSDEEMARRNCLFLTLVTLPTDIIGVSSIGKFFLKRFIKKQAVKQSAIRITKSQFGHTFVNHGEDATKFILHRAKGSGQIQGQFLNNQKAAKFILDNISKTAQGAVNVPIPKGFPARVVLPNGTFKTATHIRLVPGGKGVKTAYPLIVN